MASCRRGVLAALAALWLAAPVPGRADQPPALSQTGGVPADYAAAREKTLALGRAAVGLVAAGDARALSARFTRQMAQAIPEDQVRQTLAQVAGAGRLGKPLRENVHLEGPASRLYVADFRLGNRTLAITIIFDRHDAISGMLLSPRAPLPPDPRAGYRTQARFRLPFDGTWWVFWGGPTEAQNQHVRARDQRHAYDFCIWKQGGTHHGDGARDADYWAWGQPVLSPAEATVVAAVDGIPDNSPGQMNPQRPFGNHVILDCGRGEYLVIGHLQNGSLRVHPGERVRSGQPLGLCGNSGNSSEPHVHIHLQDRPKLYGAALGLPLAFRGYVADGKAVPRGEPVQGQFVGMASPPQNR